MKQEIITPGTPQRVGLDLKIDREEMALSLKTYRIRQGLTQQQLGEFWGVSRFTIIRAEKAKPVSWEAAYRIFARLSAALRDEQ